MKIVRVDILIIVKIIIIRNIGMRVIIITIFKLTLHRVTTLCTSVCLKIGFEYLCDKFNDKATIAVNVV